MRLFNNNKVTESLKMQVNSLNGQITSLRDGWRNALLGLSHDGKRDLNDVYGYPDNLSGTDGYYKMYDMAKREGIANRLTFGTARTCWREGFEVFDSGEADANELFAGEIIKLNKSKLINKLERADILNRIGAFSVLYVGIPDGLDPKNPVGRVSGDGLKSIFFKPFAYDGIEIVAWNKDPTSKRFGEPELYQVSRRSRGDTEKDITGTNSMTIHWTRVIHLNEGALDSDVEGMGYLEPIYNRILDLNKACGGSSEAYFRNSKGKIAFEVDKDFTGITSQEDKDNLDAGAKKFTNEAQDHIYAMGSKVTAVNTPHASPLDTVKVLLWEIAGYSGYPIRVLTGEGSGQLAGSEDQLAVNAIISDRQNTFCAQLVCNLFEILAMAGMVEWKDTYQVRFPKQSTVTEMQQVELDNKKADTLLKVAQSKSQIGGDEIELRSAMDDVGLNDIDLESVPDIDIDEE